MTVRASLPSGAVRRLPLPDGRWLAGEMRDGRLSLHLDACPACELAMTDHGDKVLLRPLKRASTTESILWAASYWLFASGPDMLEAVGWELSEAPATALRSGLLVPPAAGREPAWLVRRDMFWQLPWPWLASGAGTAFPQTLRISDGKRHPLRPPKPSGEIYRRFDARLGAYVSLRTLDIATDLERFNRWQNSPRVLHFWQEGGTLDQHIVYLQRLLADPHAVTLIGCFDDDPFAYFEVYWAKEDRIAPFYASDDYDRGIHMLVGEETHRGPHKVASWLSALIHYAFLDDPRTRLIVSEPRADNARMIAHMQAQRFSCEREFDFPHKRAALMTLHRDAFFDRCPLR